MLFESLGYNLMSVSMLCDLDLIAVFGKYGCVIQMVSDNSTVFWGVRKGDLYNVDFLKVLGLLHACLQELLSAGYGIATRSCRHEESANTDAEETCPRNQGNQIHQGPDLWCM